MQTYLIDVTETTTFQIAVFATDEEHAIEQAQTLVDNGNYYDEGRDFNTDVSHAHANSSNDYKKNAQRNQEALKDISD